MHLHTSGTSKQAFREMRESWGKVTVIKTENDNMINEEEINTEVSENENKNIKKVNILSLDEDIDDDVYTYQVLDDDYNNSNVEILGGKGEAVVSDNDIDIGFSWLFQRDDEFVVDFSGVVVVGASEEEHEVGYDDCCVESMVTGDQELIVESNENVFSGVYRCKKCVETVDVLGDKLFNYSRCNIVKINDENEVNKVVECTGVERDMMHSDDAVTGLEKSEDQDDDEIKTGKDILTEVENEMLKEHTNKIVGKQYNEVKSGDVPVGNHNDPFIYSKRDATKWENKFLVCGACE